MSIVDIIPGAVLGLREGLEAFLIVGIMIRFLGKIGRSELQSSVRLGLVVGVVASAILGLALWGITRILASGEDAVGELWASAASLAGLVLLSLFIYWMMRHGKTVVGEVQGQVGERMSRAGLVGLAAVAVLREGAEIALFSFASVNQRPYVLGVLIGVAVAAGLAYLISRSLIRVNLSVLFTVTLAYLVLQAGYLFGYAAHELISVLTDGGLIPAGGWIGVKAFDFGGSVLDHKTGPLGIVLNVLIGWYSRPEWIPLILHYGYIATMAVLWRRVESRRSDSRTETGSGETGRAEVPAAE